MTPDLLDPYLGVSWQELGVLDVRADGDRFAATAALGYPAATQVKVFAERLTQSVGGSAVELTLDFEAPPPLASQGNRAPGVKHVVAVASGKGGVGKSTTAVNLALALAAEGARTGVLDADIYGPSQGLMLGVAAGKRPDVEDEKFFRPLKAHGIEAMSMSFLVTEKTPMVWRGPMVSGALQQLILQTRWSDLDYLIVDMPPGTGDIQLTLAQKVAVSGAVIVTTPQDIALADARKGIEMFAKVDIPVLGIVENMSVHVCPSCGHQSHPFGEGGGKRIAGEYATHLLGELPLTLEIREQTDGGRPPVIADPGGMVAERYRDTARHMAARLWERARSAETAPVISTDDD